jgi:signal transduction histidine kinase
VAGLVFPKALNELRRFRGRLAEDDAGAPLAPQPGVDQLEGLVARMRGAGLPIDLTVVGDARPLTPGLDVVAYRFVQEALTNAATAPRYAC